MLALSNCRYIYYHVISMWCSLIINNFKSIIAPHASDPYETLAMIYEENGDEEKAVQVRYRLLILVYMLHDDAS